jgi:translation initiation factor 2D
MAVGTCEIDINALQSVHGTKGHAVRISHWCGDELWGWSSSGKPGKEPPASLEGWQAVDGSVEALAGQTESVTIEDGGDDDGGDGGISLSTEGVQRSEETREQPDAGLDAEENSPEVVSDRELTTAGKDGRPKRYCNTLTVGRNR